MNTELLEALDILEKEKNISKDVMLEAIENSLLSACKNHFGKADNVHARQVTILYTQREKLLKKYLILQSRSVLRMQRRSIRHFISEISHRLSFIPRNSDVLQHRMQRT